MHCNTSRNLARQLTQSFKLSSHGVHRFSTKASTSHCAPNPISFPRCSRQTLTRIYGHGNTFTHQKRGFHVSPAAQHAGIDRPEPGTGIKMHFKDSKGNLIKTVEANEGDDILAIAHEYDIDLEGACEGSVACSTCHVILEPDVYDKLPEPEDDENDMLDMAFGLTDTSRLGCQVKLTKELDGMTATLPSATRNMFVDGKKPAHH
ncbi:mitochondrial matrix iron-sulfur protein [Moniliophthora roreri]|nr:mitochondrial matrix iron-sulfur protein [Moniliophthora roreri]